jgi:hypothetical protein
MRNKQSMWFLNAIVMSMTENICKNKGNGDWSRSECGAFRPHT